MSNCTVTTVPSGQEYFEGLDVGMLCLTIICIVIGIGTCILGIFHVYVVRIYVSKELRFILLLWLSGVFPVTATFAVIGLSLPRTLAVVDAFTITYYSMALLAYIMLVRSVFHGIENMEKQLFHTKIKLDTPPCCCWKCLPGLAPIKTNIRAVEWMVVQGALVRPLLLIIGCLLFMEKRGSIPLYEQITAIISSISGLVAIWGANILSDLTQDNLKNTGVPTIGKILQVTITIHNLQTPFFELLLAVGVFGCTDLLTEKYNSAVWNHIVLAIEMFLLSLIVTWSLKPSENAVFDKVFKGKPGKDPKNDVEESQNDVHL